MLAWRIGVIIAIVQPRSKSDRKAWPFFFLESFKILQKQWPTLRVFQLSPPDRYGLQQSIHKPVITAIIAFLLLLFIMTAIFASSLPNITQTIIIYHYASHYYIIIA